MKITETRIGGTKIVQGNFHPELSELMQVGADPFRVLKQG